jgi:hypothetical protein
MINSEWVNEWRYLSSDILGIVGERCCGLAPDTGLRQPEELMFQLRETLDNPYRRAKIPDNSPAFTVGVRMNMSQPSHRTPNLL